MGVPAFFRWLCMRNPQIVKDAVENLEDDEESCNPEIDNLYLDMNGIIHPCTHPENGQVPVPSNFAEMCNNLIMYIDKLMNIVRPKKLLYMAIDGVAPRAKMNQQRGRRFKAAQESEKSQQKKQELRQFWLDEGIVDSRIDEYIAKSFDSNVITPGTEFMHDLSVIISFYIYERMNNDPNWGKIKIVFSDANVPGEGEHKILEFIRIQRTLENYNPNTRHCLYGADADLIMLGLSTHEPYFYIIRETFISQNEKYCNLCGQQGHFFNQCQQYGDDQTRQQQQIQSNTQIIRDVMVDFQFAKLFVMRQYLDIEFRDIEIEFQYNLERIIDDFVFMCFFVGNDFLPHIPTLSIREGGIDALLFLYKKCLPLFGGYLTENGEINIMRIDLFLKQIAAVELDMLNELKKKQERQMQKDQRQFQENQRNQKPQVNLQDLKKEKSEKGFLEQFKKQLKDINQQEGLIPPEMEDSQSQNLSVKQKYYQEKFRINPGDFPQLIFNIRQSYIEALCWNYAYYYKGCISWGWFYPYHYSPFASDLVDIDNLKIEFQKGQPFTPFQQLLAVFPPRSSHAVPKCFHSLMHDEESELIDYYPKDFFVDLKGKKFAWLGEVVLPFIEENRLITASKKFEGQLNEHEKFRNRLGQGRLYIKNQNILNAGNEQNQKMQLNYQQVEIGGFINQTKVKFEFGSKIQKPEQYSKVKLDTISQNQVYCFGYDNPTYKKHDCELKSGLIMPPDEIDEVYMGKSDRRSYAGENAIRIIERSLGLQKNKYGKNSKLIEYEPTINNYQLQQLQLGSKLAMQTLEYQDNNPRKNNYFFQQNRNQQNQNNKNQLGAQNNSINIPSLSANTNIFENLPQQQQQQKHYQQYSHQHQLMPNQPFRNFIPNPPPKLQNQQQYQQDRQPYHNTYNIQQQTGYQNSYGKQQQQQQQQYPNHLQQQKYLIPSQLQQQNPNNVYQPNLNNNNISHFQQQQQYTQQLIQQNNNVVNIQQQLNIPQNQVQQIPIHNQQPITIVADERDDDFDEVQEMKIPKKKRKLE